MNSWEEIRRSVLIRDEHCCKRCGISENLHVHHLIPRNLGGNDFPYNLIALCPACHANHHLSLQTSLARKFIENWSVKIAQWIDFDKQLPSGDFNLGPILRLFGSNRFRTGQLEVILAALKGSSFLHISPTGSGKSLCFQLPCMLREGYYMIISPLKALMSDQVGKLHGYKIPATFINSDLNKFEKENRLEMLEKGYFKFLYVAPERFGEKVSIAEVKRLKKIKPTALVIDEAHVIPKWERSFRPDYGKLGALKEELQSPQVLAFTATAGIETQKRIIEQLGFTEESMKVFLNDIDRPNILLIKKSIINDLGRLACISQLKQKVPKGKTMIFVPTVKVGVKVAEAFKSIGVDIPFYHSKLDSLNRENILNRYMGRLEPEFDDIICTNAFGMGLDIPNVRLVVHWQHPASIEDYVQEYGRAGRDGKDSIALLFYDNSKGSNDIRLQDYMLNITIENSNLDEVAKKEEYDFQKKKLGQINEYALSNKCLRKQILLYFKKGLDATKKPLSVRILDFIFSHRNKIVKNKYCCSNCTNIGNLKNVVS